MSKKLKELKNWASQNITLINLLPINTTCKVTTRLIDVLEDEVDEKYYLSEEKTKKLTLNEDLSGRLNHYDYRDVDSVHSVNKVSPTLNTMQGGDRQPKVAIKEATKKGYAEAMEGDSVNTSFPNSKTRRGRVGKQVAQTLQAGEVNQGVVTNDIRIRKLTEKECWRLQGFTDEQFYKAKNAGVSKSQLYKQAGNAVTVNVVDAIVGELE
ncbi:DNA cytosine methyltransferase [Staphylococcus haemolyticus]|uniref:DNA cytosine methyltransferase n=1 Tax=Staphylococcus haemolyticus TaxID=1283 RepID=UPI0034D5996F